jgi:hypothetical protein
MSATGGSKAEIRLRHRICEYNQKNEVASLTSGTRVVLSDEEE